MPLVSIIIPSYNSARTLRSCLNSIENQSYPKSRIEVIVVDKFSMDDTPAIVRAFGAKLISTKAGRSAARNIGAKVAKGNYMLFLDSDMILSPRVIEECVKKMEGDKSLVGLYIPERVVGSGFWVKVRNFERSFYSGPPIEAVMFLRKNVFFKVGGFDEELYAGEDWDLDRRVRQIGKVGVISSPLYHDEGKFSIKEYLRKKRYYARGLVNYIQKWGENDPIIQKQLGIKYRLFNVFMENEKWKKIIRNPLLALGMYFLRFTVGLQYLLERKSLKDKLSKNLK
ncbi:MAG: glycosyltransferase [Thaumarchaeota archaeon]|nr:glycosyltransferase [Nitrososphaerota archaeon]